MKNKTKITYKRKIEKKNTLMAVPLKKKMYKKTVQFHTCYTQSTYFRLLFFTSHEENRFYRTNFYKHTQLACLACNISNPLSSYFFLVTTQKKNQIT